MSNTLKITGILLLFVLILAVGPLLTVWALNTLFPVLAIPYNFWTWLAVIILGMAIRSNVNIKK